MDLSQKPEVRELIREEVRKCNETLPESTRVRRFLLLTKDLDADDAEMTRTRKVRRRFIGDKYQPLVTALYSGADHAAIETAVRFEDGRTGTIKADLAIRDMTAQAAAPAPLRKAS
jgi:long-chain acyl-CoA synthetase